MSKTLSVLSAAVFAGCSIKTTTDQSDTGAAASGGTGSGGGGSGGGGGSRHIYDVQMGDARRHGGHHQ